MGQMSLGEWNSVQCTAAAYGIQMRLCHRRTASKHGTALFDAPLVFT